MAGYQISLKDEGVLVRVTLHVFHYHDWLEVGHWEGWYWYRMLKGTYLISHTKADKLRKYEGLNLSRWRLHLLRVFLTA